jgi:DNA-binding CsgD family transcriptional regulator
MFQNPEHAFGGTAPLLDTIETIYSAVNHPDRWCIVLEEIAELIRGESTCLFAALPETSVLSLARMDPAAWNVFSSYYASINVWMERGDAFVPDGAVRYSHRVITDPELERTEFYNDYLVKNDMQYAAGLKIPLGSNLSPAFISSQRARSNGPFEESEGLVLRTLLPHLRRALILHYQTSQMKTRILGLGAAFDAFDQAVFCIDATGLVVFSNRLGETLLRTNSGLRLVQNRLRAALPDADRSLQLLIKSALNLTLIQSQVDAPQYICIDRSNHTQPLRLSAAPFRPDGKAPANNITALVIAYDPERKPASRSHALQALYGLTPTETRVAEHLLAGLEIRELAAKMAMTLETARFHVKRILSKTGARRQSELMRLMLSLPGV